MTPEQKERAAKLIDAELAKANPAHVEVMREAQRHLRALLLGPPSRPFLVQELKDGKA